VKRILSVQGTFRGRNCEMRSDTKTMAAGAYFSVRCSAEAVRGRILVLIAAMDVGFCSDSAGAAVFEPARLWGPVRERINARCDGLAVQRGGGSGGPAVSKAVRDGLATAVGRNRPERSENNPN